MYILITNRLGRHKAVVKMTVSTSHSLSNEIDRIALEAIFNQQKSEILTLIKNVKVDSAVIQQCCFNVLLKLFVNPVDMCIRTLFCYEDWLQAKQYRITGTTC